MREEAESKPFSARSSRSLINICIFSSLRRWKMRAACAGGCVIGAAGKFRSLVCGVEEEK
jgi:hypothetical protein